MNVPPVTLTAGTTTVAGSLTAVPFTSKVSPLADTAVALVFCSQSPDPLTFRMLSPGSTAVPRSTVPPLTAG